MFGHGYYKGSGDKLYGKDVFCGLVRIGDKVEYFSPVLKEWIVDDRFAFAWEDPDYEKIDEAEANKIIEDWVNR